MTIRVTEMAKDPGNPQARLARASRMFSCLVAGDRVEVRSSDYEEKDLARLAPEILKAIVNKKRLLLGTPYQFPIYSIDRRTRNSEIDMVSRN
jgi:hypothetical protein